MNWPIQIYPYAGNRQAYKCPSVGEGDVSYCANQSLCGWGYTPPSYSDWGPAPPLSLGRITNDTASIVLMGDVGDFITKYMTAGGVFPYGPLGMEWYANCSSWSYTPGLHHNGGSNMGFVDGHAKWVSGPRGFIVKQTYNGITWDAKSHPDGW